MTDDPADYYKKNREARIAYQREYYRKNREKILRKAQLDIELHPEKAEKYRQYQRNYYLKNKEKLLARKKEKYRRNVEQARGAQETVADPAS